MSMISENKRRFLAGMGREEAQVYVLMSACTRSPYVVCDEETFDDEVLLYLDETAAKEKMKQLSEEKIPVTVQELKGNQMLLFFSNLYTMGVNAIRLEPEGEIMQIEEIVKRRDVKDMPEGSVWIENPQLHLTALYFAQELRKPLTPETGERLRELQEELQADFKKGTFIFAIQKEGPGTPMVKLKDGKKYQPVFTDIMEFRRFDRGDQFRPAVVKSAELVKVLDKTANGVILNVSGVNLPLLISRPVPAAPTVPDGQATPDGAGSAGAIDGSGQEVR